MIVLGSGNSTRFETWQPRLREPGPSGLHSPSLPFTTPITHSPTESTDPWNHRAFSRVGPRSSTPTPTQMTLFTLHTVLSEVFYPTVTTLSESVCPRRFNLLSNRRPLRPHHRQVTDVPSGLQFTNIRVQTGIESETVVAIELSSLTQRVKETGRVVRRLDACVDRFLTAFLKTLGDGFVRHSRVGRPRADCPNPVSGRRVGRDSCGQ